MKTKLIRALFLCPLLLSFALPAFAQLSDFSADNVVPDTTSFAWLAGSAAAGLAAFRVYLGKKR